MYDFVIVHATYLQRFSFHQFVETITPIVRTGSDTRLNSVLDDTFISVELTVRRLSLHAATQFFGVQMENYC